MGQKGRPSRNQQLELQKVLRTYYERNLSASYAAQSSGTNIKTVAKYYMIWSEQISKASEADFIARQRQEREQTILGYDGLISRLYELLDTITSQISMYKKQKKEIPKSLLDRNLQTINAISALYAQKGSFALQRTPDESLKKIVGELMKRCQN